MIRIFYKFHNMQRCIKAIKVALQGVWGWWGGWEQALKPFSRELGAFAIVFRALGSKVLILVS